MKTLFLILISFTLNAQTVVGYDYRPNFKFSPSKPVVTKCIGVRVIVPANSCLEKIIRCEQLPVRDWYSLEEKEKLKSKYPGIRFIEAQIEGGDGRIEEMTLKELRDRICGCKT